MYDELYAAWRLETENSELVSLSSDFFARAAEYLRKIKEQKQTQDKNVCARLLEHEMVNAVRMTQELVSTRHRKLLKMLSAGKKVPVESLTSEETAFHSSTAPSAEAFNRFAEGILQGTLVKLDVGTDKAEMQIIRKRVTLRFLKPVPSIIGSDMKSYGPFMVEDVASVPAENAKILVKQGLAKIVEVQ